MKKLFTLILALIAALSLCACGSDTPAPSDAPFVPTGTNDQTIPSTTDATQPSAPTTEEWEILHTYRNAVYALHMEREDYAYFSYTTKEYNDEDLIPSVTYHAEDSYTKLAALDKSVIEKWKGTEHLSSDYWNDPLVDWDYDAVMARFTKLEDVLLTRDYTYYDMLGNETHKTIQGIYAYNEQGESGLYSNNHDDVYGQWRVFSLIDNDPRNPAHFRNSEYNLPDYTYDENGRITQVKYHDGDTVTGLATAVYDSAGNKIKDIYNTGATEQSLLYSYNSQNQLAEVRYLESSVSEYTICYEYDSNGNVSKITHDKEDDSWYSTNIVEFTYDADGKLISCVRTEGDEVETYTFHYDEKGRISTADVIFTHGEYQHKAVIEHVYGTYYVYTPAE